MNHDVRLAQSASEIILCENCPVGNSSEEQTRVGPEEAVTALGLLLEEKLLSPESIMKARELWFTSVIFFFPARAPVLVLFCCVVCCSCCCYFYVAGIIRPVKANSREEGWQMPQLPTCRPGMMLPTVGRWLINIIKMIPFQPTQRPVSQVTAIPVPFVLASSQNPWGSLDFVFCSREAPQGTGPCPLAHHLPWAS